MGKQAEPWKCVSWSRNMAVGKHKKRHITDHTALQIHTVMTILHQYTVKNQNQMTPK